MAGRKRSHCFCVTINHADWSKSCLGEYLTAGNLVKRLAIGEEKYSPPLDPDTGSVDDTVAVGRHHHCFIDFVDNYFLVEVQDIINLFLGGDPYSLDIQLSKEDRSPYLFNVRVSELSLYARCWYHARTKYRTIRDIDKVDEFICSLGQNARFAVGLIEQHVKELRTEEALRRRVFEPNLNCKVTRDILGVLNDGLSHLYLVGAPGCGKTEVVDWFLKGKTYWKAGESSGFVFGTLGDNVEFIWFEDFDMFKYEGHLNTLLSLMDHKETTVSKKCCDDRTIVSPARHVYISNNAVPGDYPMFKRRVSVIDVNYKMHECAGCGDITAGLQGLTDAEVLNSVSRVNTTTQTKEYLNCNSDFGLDNDM
ncbi:unnamed protein product [Rotaria sp. Silwood1]|nr:unnamed protein product [Rotaria sp. Silwood1]CAF1257845.1 unnamed protein product [Rotaria sp. Silwood1]